MSTKAHPGAIALVGALSVILLAGCAAEAATPVPSASTSPQATADAAPSMAVVAGYAVGEFPAVPLFTLPDLALLDASADGFTIDVRDDFAAIPGVTVTAAHCDESGTVVAGSGSATLYGDGSGNYTGADGEISNYGDGSGSFTLNGVTVENYGDGSGSYDDGTVSIQNYGDGSGSYSDASMEVHIYGDGSGDYTAGAVQIHNYGDGSGSYEDGTTEINNYGDGSGDYLDADVEIHNYGDGTGTVNGTDVEMEPIAAVAPLGVFPPLAALQPIESCGTVITFADGVLFDFDKSDIRADAAETLKTVAEALNSYEVPAAVVSGHTDAIGSDAYNQTLSEQRASSVVDALQKAGVTTTLTAEGYGESRPVAANEIDGADNPAGRQLNRRVEIFIPATL
ncbi:OmpA family protein [Microbacterium sp. NPDC055903]